MQKNTERISLIIDSEEIPETPSLHGLENIRKPIIDSFAFDMKKPNFYAASSVSSPSRAGLLTGGYPVRCSMASDVQRVLFPDSMKGCA